jgi:hypothetical protein
MQVRVPILMAAGAAAALALTAAQRPAALAQASPGLWEISGVPGSKAPIRECVADLVALGRFEHRGRSCKSDIIRSNGSTTLLSYSCRGGSFGRSEISVVTPRNLRIGTQGISDNLPFNYVLQARRIGDCPPKTSAAAAH